MAEALVKDRLFLEATHDAAVVLLEGHAKRPNWTVTELKEKHDYPGLLFEVSRREEPLDLPASIPPGLALTLLTENGIVYYPRDVGRIFNPLNKKPSDNDPHEAFVRSWTSEEWPHSRGLEACLELTGYDMTQLERDAKAFHLSGLVPNPVNSARGTAYTGTQERSTSTPYQNMKQQLKEAMNTTQDELSRRVMAFIYDVLLHVSQDERFHGKFINGIAQAALSSGEKQVVSYMLSGIRPVVIEFAMPGDPGIPDFKHRSERAHLDCVFTLEDVSRIKYDQIVNVWKVQEQTELTSEGEQEQARILAYAEKLTKRFPKLVELGRVA